jgi:glycosyltransferase involved in cell wall biosynthesis
MVVLIVSDFFYPSYKAGGIVQSLKNLLELDKCAIEFKVITSNKDLDGVSVKDCGDLLNVVDYLPPMKVIRALNNTRWSGIDVIYLNGIFSPFYFVLPLFYVRIFHSAVKVIIAPRGMLQSGAMEIRKTKKQIYLVFLKKLKIFDKVRWHATDNQEEIDIKNFQENADVILARNIPKPPWNAAILLEAGNLNPLKLVFLSLITEKKNLHLVLEALMGIDFHVVFNIYGPVADEKYWNLCCHLISCLPSNVKCQYHGAIRSELSQEIFSKHHALILPSKGENFGHAIYECLSVGRPVIIGKNTPWKNIEQKQAGWLVDLTLHDISSAIVKLGKTGQDDFHLFCSNAINIAKDYFCNSDFNSDYLRLFNENLLQNK